MLVYFCSKDPLDYKRFLSYTNAWNLFKNYGVFSYYLWIGTRASVFIGDIITVMALEE